jgi:hypothetical protein
MAFTDRFLEAKGEDHGVTTTYKFNPFDVSFYNPDYQTTQVYFKNGEMVVFEMEIHEFEVLLNSVNHT